MLFFTIQDILLINTISICVIFTSHHTFNLCCCLISACLNPGLSPPYITLVAVNLPPDSSGDLDTQMSENVRILNELRQDLSQDLFISYHPGNVPHERGGQVNPMDVVADLEAAGYTWYVFFFVFLYQCRAAFSAA